MPTPAFDSLHLSPALLTVIGELGYTQPTPVQSASIPALLAGSDLLGQSKTGSGKTAAFALPILQRLDLESRNAQALVLCPTRELCAQVAREVRTLGRRLPGLAVLEVVGGQPIWRQIHALRRGVHIVVGTPGRLLDHLKRGSLELRAVATVVLDEADRMLDMGFVPDVESILAALPAERQTVLFSATIPQPIATLSRNYQRDAVRVTIDQDDPSQAAPDIRQWHMVTEPDEKLHALCWLLQRFPHESALVFCNYKTSVLEVSEALSAAGVSVGRLDGDMDQYHRDQVLARFRNQSVRLLVATDVAGRGIDIDGLDLVVNYELHDQPDVYVHRIGRTGRAGQQGVAVTLATARQTERLAVIQTLTGRPIETLEQDAAFRRNDQQLLRAIPAGKRMETLLISGGRKDKVRPGDILGALTGEAGGLKSTDVGRIEIQDRLSYVAVSRKVARHAVQQLNRGRIKGKRFRATWIEGDEDADLHRGPRRR